VFQFSPRAFELVGNAKQPTCPYVSLDTGPHEMAPERLALGWVAALSSQVQKRQHGPIHIPGLSPHSQKHRFRAQPERWLHLSQSSKPANPTTSRIPLARFGALAV